jgi:hypothetical protein
MCGEEQRWQQRQAAVNAALCAAPQPELASLVLKGLQADFAVLGQFINTPAHHVAGAFIDVSSFAVPVLRRLQALRDQAAARAALAAAFAAAGADQAALAAAELPPEAVVQDVAVGPQLPAGAEAGADHGEEAVQPSEAIEQLAKFLRDSQLPISTAGQLLAEWRKEGHVTQLERRCFFNKRSVRPQAQRAIVTWTLPGSHGLQLTSPQLAGAIPYTLNDEARFVQQQQAGAGFLQVEIVGEDSPQSTISTEEEQAMFERLDLEAVALLKWRLQDTHDLPLGVLEGMEGM